MVKGNFELLNVNKNIISLFASGTSVLDLSDSDLGLLKEKTYVIGTNFCFYKFIPHLLVWGDKRVSNQIWEHHKETGPICEYASREQAFNKRVKSPLQPLVKYWINPDHYKLKGNYTIFWLLQLLRRYFPNKKILLFGLDFYAPEGSENVKWIDSICDVDKKQRNTKSYIKPKGVLNNFHNQLCSWATSSPNTSKNIINCNPKSKFEYFEKIVDWKTLI